MHLYGSPRFRRAFTLIELLVVIAIIAILAVVVVLTLNPAQLLAQSRDANRVSDMATLSSALGLYQTDTGGIGTMGTSTYVYASLADTSSTCGSWGLPALPTTTTYTYNCTVSTSSRLTNSNGWVPVNFSTISAGAPLGALPLDPTNTSSTRLFYAYTSSGGQYELAAGMESTKYKLGGSSDVISNDGGILANTYEKGTKLGLLSLDYGDPSLVGYWPFNEGAGNVSGTSPTADWSGNGNTGIWAGVASGTSGYYSPGKIGSWAGTFDGTSTYVSLPSDVVSVAQIRSAGVTYSAWIKMATSSISQEIVGQKPGAGYSDFCSGGILVDGNNKINMVAYDDNIAYKYAVGSTTLQVGNWYFVAGVYNALNKTIQAYLSGQAEGSPVNITTFCRLLSNASNSIGKQNFSSPENFSGLIDDVRIYKRALSAAEIQAMYNAGK